MVEFSDTLVANTAVLRPDGSFHNTGGTEPGHVKRIWKFDKFVFIRETLGFTLAVPKNFNEYTVVETSSTLS